MSFDASLARLNSSQGLDRMDGASLSFIFNYRWYADKTLTKTSVSADSMDDSSYWSIEWITHPLVPTEITELYYIEVFYTFWNVQL